MKDEERDRYAYEQDALWRRIKELEKEVEYWKNRYLE